MRKAPLNRNPQHQTSRWIFEHDNNGQLVKCAENKRQEGGINIITISIRYKMMNSKNWLNISLTADDYFDLDPEEDPEIWSVPKSDKPLDYIKYNQDSVESIILSISDPVKNERLTIKQKFWNGQQNYLLESVEEKQGNIDIELILQTLVQDDPNNEIWEIIRFSREDGLLSPTFHSFITENQEGLVSEKIIPVRKQS